MERPRGFQNEGGSSKRTDSQRNSKLEIHTIPTTVPDMARPKKIVT